MILEMLTQAATAAGPGGFGEIWSHIVADFSNITEPAALAAFVQVLMIDIVLAGDNAIVVGALAAGLPADQRKKVILIGVLAALVLRIAFALVVTQLMQIVGLIFVGGLLLIWVAWKMWRELREGAHSAGSPEIEGDEHSGLKPAQSFAAAAWAVAIARSPLRPPSGVQSAGQETSDDPDPPLPHDPRPVGRVRPHGPDRAE